MSEAEQHAERVNRITNDPARIEKRKRIAPAIMVPRLSDGAGEVILDEAVYAAAFAVYGSGFDGSPQKDAWLKDFRVALEAALPHMLAGPHPTMSSAVTAASNAHIAICPQCQETFG